MGDRDGEVVLRWHALFAAQCRGILHRADPEAYRATHRILAGAREATDLAAAVAHAGAAEDGELAARILRDRWADRVIAGEHETVRTLLALVPSPWRDGPELAVAGAALCAVEGRPDLAADQLAHARRALGELPDDRRAAVETTATLVELFVASRAGLADAVQRGRAIVDGDRILSPSAAALAAYLVGRAEAYSEYDDARSLAHLRRGAALARSRG